MIMEPLLSVYSNPWLLKLIACQCQLNMSDAEEPCLQKEEHISQGILRLVNSQIAYHEIWRETET